MTTRYTLALLALLAVPRAALAQHGGVGGPTLAVAPREATQYDFLIGQWELVVRPQVPGLAARIHGSPTLEGTWKAWRGFDGWGIEDELRVVDHDGNTRALTHAVRVYDPAARHWNISTLDVFRSRFTTATAEWQGNQVTVSSQGTDQEGKGYMQRTRLTDITPTTFKMQQERSYDEGRTWAEPTLRIEARRVAATAPR